MNNATCGGSAYAGIPGSGGTVSKGQEITIKRGDVNPNFDLSGITSDFGFSLPNANNSLIGVSFRPSDYMRCSGTGTLTFNYKRKQKQITIPLMSCISNSTAVIIGSNNLSFTNGGTKSSSITRTNNQSFFVDSGTCISIIIDAECGETGLDNIIYENICNCLGECGMFSTVRTYTASYQTNSNGYICKHKQSQKHLPKCLIVFLLMSVMRMLLQEYCMNALFHLHNYTISTLMYNIIINKIKILYLQLIKIKNI